MPLAYPKGKTLHHEEGARCGTVQRKEAPVTGEAEVGFPEVEAERKGR